MEFGHEKPDVYCEAIEYVRIRPPYTEGIDPDPDTDPDADENRKREDSQPLASGDG